MTAGTTVSIILPAYRDAEQVRGVIPEMIAEVQKLGVDFEVIIVVNGPRDGTDEAAEELRLADPRIRVLRAAGPGWGRAVRSGLAEATGDLLAYTNLARTPPHVLRTAIALALDCRGSVVKATRRVRDSARRRGGSLLYNLECRALFDLSAFDVNGTPKVFPAEFTDLRQLTRDDDLIDIEFLAVCRFARLPGRRVLGAPAPPLLGIVDDELQVCVADVHARVRAPPGARRTSGRANGRTARLTSMEGVALVTGGAGFVGANLVRRLVREGADVHLVLQGEGPHWRLADLSPAPVVHAGSVTDADRIAEIVAAVRPRWVFHLAAHGAYSAQTDPDRITAVNALGTFNLLDAVERTCGCEGFVHTGSSSEYGLKDHPPSEDERVQPGSIYAITKCAATHAVSYWARERGLPAATVRLYSVYGYWEGPSRLVPRLLLAALAGTLPPLTAPATARDFVWIDDTVDAIVAAVAGAARRPGAIWNVGSGRQTSLADLVSIAREVFGVETTPLWGTMADRSWDTDCWISDARRAHDELGWTARTALEDGLRAMAAWLAQPAYRAQYEP